ncbi:MAG: hemerythrin domain-containing protein [Verrucomicrobia bacterium]|nr:hemerythrin domain-containing protein [Verrucomicrobiota bacterium]
MTTWNERFETGHAQIDAEHREFFRQLNALKGAVESGAGRERVVDLITILQTYVLGHFAREEAHMARVDCPALQANCAAHRDFALKLEHWLELLTMSGTPVSMLLDVHRESIGWIEAHIINIDCRLRGCVSKGSPHEAGG